MVGDYYIGLDLGTNSVGWAVTTTDYKLVRLRGKDAWGVRLFDEGNTAADRRGSRAARRRKDRDQKRRKYIQQQLKPVIDPIDPDFYLRRKESTLWAEDTTSKNKFSIFGGKGPSDKDFYKTYPTISHLIVKIIENPEQHTDPREYALVIEHLFKHRGNFLVKGELNNTGEVFDEVYQQFIRALNAGVLNLEEDEDYDSNAYPSSAEAERILTSKNLSINDKAKELNKKFSDAPVNKLLNSQQKKSVKTVANFLAGKTDDIFKIWPDHPAKDADNKDLKLSFRDKSLEEFLTDKNISADQFSEPEMELLESIEQISDWLKLESLMKGEDGKQYQYLSEARVASYNQHKQDLRDLKDLLKHTSMDLYNRMFRKSFIPTKESKKEDQSGKIVSYSSYVGSVNACGTGKVRGKKATEISFLDSLKKELKKLSLEQLPDDIRPYYEKLREDILIRIERGQFLPKQMTAKNGVIPNQLHSAELKKILEAAQMHFPAFSAVDESGLSLSERLVMLFEFRVPYYVGPLGQGKEPGTAWAVWNEGADRSNVYPWNYEEKLDMGATSRAFIERMVRSCTYIPTEIVLPEHSLLYEKFKVLNELNNLKINGTPLTVDQKQKLYETLFLKGKKVTKKKLLKFLCDERIIDPCRLNETVITGIDGDFANKLGTEKFFCEVLNTEILTDEQRKMAEKIVYWSTVYEEGGKLLKSEITEHYPQLNEAQIKRILGNRFNGWGRFSKAFLELEGTDHYGNKGTILELLWNTNDNLMQLLSDKYSFLKELEKLSVDNQKGLFEVSSEDLDNSYLSGPVKRMIWQSIRIVREIVQLMGKSPAKIFIEMAREKDKNPKRTVSRKDKFKELYRAIKDDNHEWLKEIDALTDRQLSMSKVYLYLTQQGLDAYTGERIDFDSLMKENSQYDKDHIYAQKYTKDDSLENNLVLTNKEFNNHGKKDEYPLPPAIQEKMLPTWKRWLAQGLITQEKFNRLTRKTSFTDEELAGFINRQLVETRQGTKVLAAILKKSSPETQVVYSKASNVHDFRKKFQIPKIRELNNLHHAVDAYLNIVVGNVFSVKFTESPIRFIEEVRKGKEQYSLRKLYDFPVKRNEKTAWLPQDENGAGTITQVKKVVFKGTPIVTYRAVPRTGAFSEINLTRAQEKTIGVGMYYIPRKSGMLADPAKYGYYNSVSAASYFLVEYTNKKKRERVILPLNIVDFKKYQTKIELEKYCADELKLDKPSVRLMNIHPNSILRINGYPVRLANRTEKRLTVRNVVELVFSASNQQYLKTILSLNERNALDSSSQVSEQSNLLLYDALMEKLATPIFKKYPRAKKSDGKEFYEKLKTNREYFLTLSLDKQAEILCKMISLFYKGEDGSNKLPEAFRLLPDPRISNNPSEWAKLTENNPKQGEAILVLTSVTGLYSVEIDLLTV